MATTKATLLGHRSATSFSDLTLSGDLTVNGTTTTLDTAVQNVDKLEIGASSTDYGAKINQASTGNILQLQDGGTDVMVVKDGGNVGIGNTAPSNIFHIKSADPCVWIEDTETNGPNAVADLRFAEGTGPDNWVGLGMKSLGLNFYTGNAGNTSTGGGSVRMRIASDGKVGIGTSNPDSLLHIEHPTSHTQVFMDTSATSKACWLKIKQNNDSNRGWLFGMEGGQASLYVFDYSDSSYACHVPTGGQGWSANSDERMKKDIASMEDRLDDLLNIQVRRFKWKRNDRDAHGFIAQELVNYAPEAVEVGNDELVTQEEAEESETRKEGDLKNPWSISKEALIPMMIKSIQELSAKVTALENATN